ncbi:hypothetical protein QYE76_052188 [Lolium multiflorum]|uniref:Pentatricopeptide repeat-containing protein n=1 Tax=Lolium multiflorum TaxID=4521 RepID=A0AAD8WIY8_LOLMU|nr:hypothetical protein QYE76_052188 [Lolium multiflorum]
MDTFETYHRAPPSPRPGGCTPLFSPAATATAPFSSRSWCTCTPGGCSTECPGGTPFAWNAAIRGLVDAGRFPDVLETYRAMIRDGSISADGFTYPHVVKACAALGAVEQGRLIREHVEAAIARGEATPNVFVQCALVDMFAKCGCLDEERSMFDNMPIKDLPAWTAMIGVCGGAAESVAVVEEEGERRVCGGAAECVAVAEEEGERRVCGGSKGRVCGGSKGQVCGGAAECVAVSVSVWRCHRVCGGGGGGGGTPSPWLWWCHRDI